MNYTTFQESVILWHIITLNKYLVNKSSVIEMSLMNEKQYCIKLDCSSNWGIIDCSGSTVYLCDLSLLLTIEII